MSEGNVGNKWWSIDFHCHTPASSDYGKGEKHDVLSRTTPKEYLKFYMDKNIDSIVITDHNSGEWIDKIRQAYKELEEEKPEYFRKLVIFPGVELTVNGNIHVLAIYPENKEQSIIDNLLGAIHYGGSKGESDGCSEESFTKVVEEIVKGGGIAIPAHCNDTKGIFKSCSGTTLEQNIKCSNIFAAEITEKDYAFPQLYVDKKIEWCRILGSDAHHPTGNDGEKFHGSHYTWVKMSELTFNELKLSLQDGKMSVICSDEVNGNPNDFSQPIIKQVEVENAMYLGRSKKFDIEFSPWLNSIIGGRGTGKSTVIEFIRTIFNRENELPSSLNTDIKKYTEKNNGKNSNGLMLENTLLRAYYVKDNKEYKAEWSYDTNTSKIFLLEDGEYIPTDGNIENRFPIRIYSQKQIFELARQPKALLDIINDSDEISYNDWKVDFEKLLNKYFTITYKIKELKVDMNGVSMVKGQIEDINNKLELFKKNEYSDVLEKYSNARRVYTEIYKIDNYYNEQIEKYKKFVDKINNSVKLKTDLNNENDIEREVLELTANLQQQDRNLLDIFINKIEEFQKLKEMWNKGIKETRAIKDYEEIKTKYEKLQSELQKIGVNNTNEYTDLLKKREELLRKLSKIDEINIEMKRLEEERLDVYEDILTCRKEITDRRKKFVEKVLSDNKYVRIDIIPFGDKEDVTSSFRKILGREKGFDQILGSDEEQGLISKNIYSASTVLEGLNNVKQQINKIYKDGQADGYDKRFCNVIQSLSSDVIDKIDTWFPEDSLQISYAQSNNKFKPIENASPGQKTATLLAFILSYGNEPLILDQPEDDLDNSLISELIVNNLRQEKRHRQVIVVTHNANIVVNGDSDNVIVMHIAGGLTQIACKNGLQNLKVRKYICDIMEGGKKAFEKRYRRININEIQE